MIHIVKEIRHEEHFLSVTHLLSMLIANKSLERATSLQNLFLIGEAATSRIQAMLKKLTRRLTNELFAD